MDKRQDAQPRPARVAAWLILCLVIVSAAAACQAELNPATIELSPPAEPIQTDTPASAPTAPRSPAPDISPATPIPDCLSQGGTFERESMFSDQLGENLFFRVYLPPCYEFSPEQRYPVVYLLHGLTFNEDQWARLGLAEQMDSLIASGAIPPFIVVLPGEARFTPPQTSPFDDALVQELVPWVDQHYRTHAEKAFRSIGGLSRGAAWSVRIGFENPKLFSSVGAHSLPLFEADGGRLDAWLAHFPGEDVPEFFIDIGRNDPERRSAQSFADQLDAHNIPHTWYLFNGSHTEDYWSAHLAHYLRWYARNW